MDPGEDLVVLLSADGSPAGVMPKREVHHDTTPLHAAFSSYLFSPNQELLMTRRALTKTAWPGVWTNTVCGHPRPGENLADAVDRRTQDELGIQVRVVQTLLPHFSYRAVDASGVVENEVCPVVLVEPQRPQHAVEHSGEWGCGPLVADPEEVCEVAWVPWRTVVSMAQDAQALLSPWCVLQVLELVAAGWEPTRR